MRIVLCGMLAFYDDMVELKSRLEALGHAVSLPSNESSDSEGRLVAITEFYDLDAADRGWIWESKRASMLEAFGRIRDTEAVLVVNQPSKGVAGYIDAEALIILGVAFFLGKKVFLLNTIPETDCKDELLAMQVVELKGNLKRIE